jgi:hypothetical protein
MSTINYTYNVIVDRFRQFAAGHFQLRRFTHGEISQADLEKEAEWPWLHVKPRAINYSPGTRAFQFEIFISDLPRDKEDKTGYQAESITDCSLIFQDLINEIYLGNMFGDQVVLTRPVSSEPFVEQYTHTLTGVTGTIELNLDYDWSACSIPASWNYNTPTDSPSDGWGALQFIESLDQNGVYVSLLNDEEDPGNNYYYGTDEEGVKGWHVLPTGLTCEDLPECATIISILEDIEALQTDVALKANSADLGATAFSNDYGDLDNLPTIPAAQIQSDWTQANNAALDFIKNKPTIPSIAGLVPETRTLTINGTTQDLSANRIFTIATGLTIGTTPITSGTVGRVLFEGTGNVLQQSTNFFWDNTNSRLGIGTSTPSSYYAKKLVVACPDEDGVTILANTVSSTNYLAFADGVTGNEAFRGYLSYKHQTDQLTFGSAGTLRMTLFSTGNLGIATTTDAGFKLDVNGTARVVGNLAAGNLQNSLAVDGTGVKFPTVDAVNTQSMIDKGKRMLSYFFDFIGPVATLDGIQSSLSGGNISHIAGGSIPQNSVNRQGVVFYTTAAVSTNYAYHINNSTVQLSLGGGSWNFESLINISVLSSVTDRYRTIHGFASIGANVNAVETDGVFFTYDEGGTLNGTAASPNWQCVTVANSVRTLTTTSTAVTAGAWHKLRIEINAAGTSVGFYLNGTLLATHTTNIPLFSNSRYIIMKQGIAKTIGTTARTMFCDYIGYENILTTSR